MKEARQARAPVPIQHTDSFRSVKSVRGEREQFDAHRLNINRQPAAARRRIDKQRDPFSHRKFADLTNRFDRADVVIDVMNANQNRLFRERRPQIGWGHETFRVHFHPRAVKAALLQKLDRIDDRRRVARIDNRRVLDFADDNVIATALICECGAFDCEVG